MAFQLSKLKSKTMKTSIVFGGERLNFEYFPGKLNEDWFDRVQVATETEDMIELKEAILEIIASWDLMVEKDTLIAAGVYGDFERSDNGEWVDLPQDVEMLPDEMACPLKVDAIDALQVPLPIFGMINRAVQEDSQSGGKSTKKAR